MTLKYRKNNLNLKRITYISDGAELEGLFFRPNHTRKKIPAVVFIHGHNSNAWKSSWIGFLLAQRGCAVFLPTLRGYPFSGGRPDYNGPKTVKGVMEGIKIFLKDKDIDVTRIGVWGISRGATVASLLTVKYPKIFKAAVFQSGAYDMRKNFETTRIDGIREVMIKEMGRSKKAFKLRSSLPEIDKLACSVLILHGEKDERISVNEAKNLDKKLAYLKKPHKTILLQNKGHFLGEEVERKYILPFLDANLKI